MLDSIIQLSRIVSDTAVIAIFTYAAYWALSIRSALAVRLYRNQALGVALLAMTFAAVFFVVSVLGYLSPVFSPLQTFGPFSLLFVFLAILMAFYWIDASILAGRRSDPLLRDALHWRKVRPIFWTLNIAAVAFTAGIITYIQLTTGRIPPAPPVIEIIFLLPFLLTGICGVVYLPIVAARSKDYTLRKQLKWFGVFALILLVYVPAVAGAFRGLSVEEVQLVINLALIGNAYCLYKSARSLVPLNRLERH